MMNRLRRYVRFLQRRWISDSAERAGHETVVRERLARRPPEADAGDAQGRAIHLLGSLAGKVLRISPPLVMPLAEAKEYLDAMYEIFEQVGEDRELVVQGSYERMPE